MLAISKPTVLPIVSILFGIFFLRSIHDLQSFYNNGNLVLVIFGIVFVLSAPSLDFVTLGIIFVFQVFFFMIIRIFFMMPIMLFPILRISLDFEADMNIIVFLLFFRVIFFLKTLWAVLLMEVLSWLWLMVVMIRSNCEGSDHRKCILSDISDGKLLFNFVLKRSRVN